jgi:CDP-glucose 4,6-dehydratase
MLLRAYASQNIHTSITILRFSNIVGHRQRVGIIPDLIKKLSFNKKVLIRNPNFVRPWQHVLEPLSGYLSLGASLAESAHLHGESFNFGPPSRQNHSVREVVKEMSKYWAAVNFHETNSSSQVPEAGLLKLNCDKALAHLKWHAVWNFEETIKQTAEWYMNFYNTESKINNNYIDISLSQIQKYSEDAKAKGFSWAC